jgi:hypothetical protein
MAQKINPLVFRLKKRICWNSIFSSHCAVKFSKIFTHNEQVMFSLKKSLSGFKAIPNNIQVFTCAKSTDAYSKLWQKQFLLNNLFPAHSLHPISSNERRLSVVAEKKHSVLLTPTRSRYNFQLCDLFLDSKYAPLTTNLLYFKIIMSFLFSQFDKGFSMKNFIFLSNFKTASLFVLKRVLQKFKSNILGLKFSCSGKWKKTRSGRKQRFTVQFGQIKNSGVANILFYDQKTQQTKFGSCNFKVWVLSKNSNYSV